MSAAKQLAPTPAPTPDAPDAPDTLGDTLTEIADDARRDPARYARDTRVPEGCE